MPIFVSAYKEPRRDITRLKELILYIAQRSEDDERFGSVKLNKILYYADCGAYLRLGRPITEARYQHLAEGPAPVELLIAQRELLDEGAAITEERPYYNRTQRRLTPKRGSNSSLFSREELDIVDEVIADLWNLNGADVSKRSHEEWGWRLTSDREMIEFRTYWLSPEPLSQEQVEYGIGLWEELNAGAAGA
ncbi:MAG: SocA family protein [Candidatus Hydrogenedentes bacterium]|nr:SocA family protein [Candidatus Hydrogenedentota bacterium]